MFAHVSESECHDERKQVEIGTEGCYDFPDLRSQELDKLHTPWFDAVGNGADDSRQPLEVQHDEQDEEVSYCL